MRNLTLEACRRENKVRLLYGQDVFYYRKFVQPRYVLLPKKPESDFIKTTSFGVSTIPYFSHYDYARKFTRECAKLVTEEQIDSIVFFGAGTFPHRAMQKISGFQTKPIMAYYAMDTMMMEYRRSLDYGKKNRRIFLENFVRYHQLIESDRRSCGLADVVIASCKDTAEHLISDYGVPKDKIRIVYEGIPDDYADSFKPKYPSVPNFFHISGSERKGTAFFLKALEILREEYGISPAITITRASSDLLKEASKFPAGSRVYRSLPIESVKNIYNECTALVSPSLSEGFCLPVIEAGLFGKPTIASDVGSLPEIICNGQDGYLVGVGRTEDLAERMYKLASDPELQKRMGAAALEKAKRFTISNCFSELEKVLLDFQSKRSL